MKQKNDNMSLNGIVEIMRRGEKLVGMIDWPQPRYLLLEEREEFMHIRCQHNLWQETFAKDKSHLEDWNICTWKAWANRTHHDQLEREWEKFDTTIFKRTTIFFARGIDEKQVMKGKQKLEIYIWPLKKLCLSTNLELN